jgi:BASS family bile acid:Na+ symporter
VQLAALITLGIKTSIVLTTLGIGLSTTPRDAISLFRDPGRLLRSLAAMMLIVPLFAIIVARSFELEPAVKIALGALSVSPVPPLWPRKSRKAGGHDSYTIGLLAATALLSIVIIPIGVEIIDGIFAIPTHVSVGDIAAVAFVTVLGPLLAGIAVHRFAPKVAIRAARPVTLVATALLAVCVIPVVYKAWPAMTQLIGDGTLLTMVAFVVVGLIAGHILGGPSQEDRSVLALACASRHPGIALAIASVSVPNEKLVLPAVLLYLIVSSIATLPYLRWSKGQVEHEHRPIMALR